MKLIVLGSGTCIPTYERSAAAYLVSLDDNHLLFDCGFGTIRRLTEAGVHLGGIDHLFLTHLHLDHVADLFPMLFFNKHIYQAGSRNPIHLYGPRGFEDFFSTMTSAFGSQVQSESYPIHLQELAAETVKFPKWKISTCFTQHSKHSIGYRVEDLKGNSLVYSGDTDFSPALIRLARGCDLFMLECSYGEKHKAAGHLIPSEAGKMAAAAGCKKLVLTHLYPPVNQAEMLEVCSKHYPGEIIIAQDLMEFLIEAN